VPGKTKAPKTAPKVRDAKYVRREAEKEYGKGTPLPEAIRRIDVRANRPTIGLVSPVYWRLDGEASPLGTNGAGETVALGRKVAARRKSGVRWEVLAYSLSAGLGRKVSTADAKRLAAKGGLDLAASYTGRGTRVAAPKTYAAPAASVAAEGAK